MITVVEKTILMKIRILFTCSLLLSLLAGNSNATTYSLPANPNDTVITEYPEGAPLVRADSDKTLLDFARENLLGQTEIVRLNQDLDRWLVKKDQIVTIANQRILPDSPHKGITLNLAEFRMYFYPENQPGKVLSFAHGVGRQDWKTPLGQTSVAKKVKNPSWHPPESIRREHAANGDPLPEVVPPGPHNPLGAYALHLALPGEYRIHGTDIDKIYGIGMQITHGCVRMYPEDIERLYNLVPVGTPVYIIKQPIKVGWLNDKLYVEAHPDLEGEDTTMDERFASALNLIRKANKGELPEFDQQVLNDALKKQTGNPVVIYERVPGMEAAIAPAVTATEPAATPTATVSEANDANMTSTVTESSTTTSTSEEPQAAAEEPAPAQLKPARKPDPKGYYTGDIPRRPIPAQ